MRRLLRIARRQWDECGMVDLDIIARLIDLGVDVEALGY